MSSYGSTEVCITMRLKKKCVSPPKKKEKSFVSPCICGLFSLFAFLAGSVSHSSDK